MPEIREQVNIPWATHQAMKIGRLQMVGRFLVNAGESLAAQVTTEFEFHQLRRAAMLDIVTELYAFYMPHRWAYGDNFVTALTEQFGAAAHTTYLQTLTYAQPKIEGVPALMYKNKTIPRHSAHMHAAIIDHWFKERHTGTITDMNALTTKDDLDYGYLTWQLRSWETGGNWSDAYDTQKLPDNNVQALQLAHYVALAQEDQSREYTAVRTEEIHDHVYGGKLSAEAVQKPFLLMHQKAAAMQNAMKIPGTETEHGMFADMKSVMTGAIPGRFFPEHGEVQIYALARISPTYQESVQYMDDPVNFGDYRKLFCHPVAATLPPRGLQLQHLFQDSNHTEIAGYYAPLDHFRFMPDWWSYKYKTVDVGWPQRKTPTSKLNLRRHPDYSDALTTNQFGNGLLDSGILVTGMRRLGRQGDAIRGATPERTEGL